MFSFALSKFFSRAAEDDLEKFSASRNIFSNTFPKEVLINIVSFMELGTIYVFARADRFLLKFLFDQTPESIEKLSKTRKTHKKNQGDFLTTRNAVEEYQKQELQQHHFELVQKLIWKPLVCYYFPKFEKALNVKNWLHVLRRRVSHIQIHARELLPLSSNIPTEYFEIDPTLEPENLPFFIENCEFIYKCPLRFESLNFSSTNIRFCSVCSKNVYLVKSTHEMSTHISQGHCIAFGRDDSSMIFGDFVEFSN